MVGMTEGTKGSERNTTKCRWVSWIMEWQATMATYWHALALVFGVATGIEYAGTGSTLALGMVKCL